MKRSKWAWRAVYFLAILAFAWSSLRERAARMAFENEVRVQLEELRGSRSR